MLREFDHDQSREAVNTRQRFEALEDAELSLARFKGSMFWMLEKGATYLVRSAYDDNGIRRNRSLGPQGPATEKLKADYERDREAAKERVEQLRLTVSRQSAKNRAIGLGRMPVIGARIARALKAAGLLGRGIRIVGTNAIYAYEAAAGVFVDDEVLATDDIDLLFDARRELHLASSEAVAEGALLRLLQRVDRSFERAASTFRAVNRDGYLVDLIKPAPVPPWKNEPDRVVAGDNADLVAAGIEGLQWLQNAPQFDMVVVDQKGSPVRLIVPDPRAFAIHKFWLSARADRAAAKRRRDLAQAEIVARLTRDYLLHLPYEAGELTAFPLELFEAAKPLFAPPKGQIA